MAKKIGELLIDIDTQLGKLNTELAKGNKAVGAYAKKQKTILGGLKKSWLALAAGAFLLAKGIINATKVSIKFQAAIDNVRAVAGGARKELAKLAREAGKSTVFSATEAADAMYFLASAGLAVEDMAKVLTPTLNLAAAAQIDIARATDIVVNNLKVFNKDMSEAEAITDVMAKTVASSNTNMEQLADALGFAGPVASSAGISFEDLNATLATMANRGIKGGQAGTQLRQSLARLTKPSAEAEAALKKYGITTEEITKLLPTPIALFDRLHDANLSNADALAIFGVRQTGVTALIKDGVDDLHDMRDALDESAGSAKKMADVQINNVAGAMKLLKSKWEEFILLMTTGSLPAIQKFVTKLAQIVDGVSELLAITDRQTESQNKLNDIIDRGTELTEADRIAITDRGAAEADFIKAQKLNQESIARGIELRKKGIKISENELETMGLIQLQFLQDEKALTLLRERTKEFNLTNEDTIRIFQEWIGIEDEVIEKEDEKTDNRLENNEKEIESNAVKTEALKGNVEDYYTFIEDQRAIDLAKENENYQAALDGLLIHQANKKITNDQFLAATQKAQEVHAKNIDKINADSSTFLADAMAQAVGNATSTFASGVADMAVEGDIFKKNWGDLLLSLTKDAAKLILKLLIIKSLKTAFGGPLSFLGFSKGGQVPKTLYAANGANVGSMKPKGSDTIPAMLTPGERVLKPEDNNLLGQFMNRFSDIYGTSRPTVGSDTSTGSDGGGNQGNVFQVDTVVITDPVGSPEDIVGLTAQELAEKQTDSRGLRR
jgi:TP901 family phage tail tape measure protein